MSFARSLVRDLARDLARDLVHMDGTPLSAARAQDGSVVVSSVSPAPTVVRNEDGSVTVTAVH